MDAMNRVKRLVMSCDGTEGFGSINDNTAGNKIKDRIGKTLLRYKVDPLRNAERLTNSSLGSYRFRVGDYRIVFDIEKDKIVVLRVGHRRDIYRKK